MVDKSMKLGGGGRFEKLKGELSGKVRDAGAVAAKIGREKYGRKEMSRMASAGRRRSGR